GQVKEVASKVWLYVLIGVGIGALIHNWIPTSFIQSILGNNNPFGLIIATLIGAPIYADIFGVLPIAEALFSKGVPVGTLMAFMMSVTTLSLPSLIMLSRVVKPKLLGIFITICIVGILLIGFTFNSVAL
ncbi:MAG TPA: permease, partial [Candidatus Enterococcus stercoravium]|nr:permease [Candidatus Enterococcus stercoravium]